MKVKTALYVYHTQYAWQDVGSYQAYTFKADEDECRTLVGEQAVELNIPDDYDPRAQKIVALVAKKQKIMADYQQMVTEINAKISNLQALEYTA